VIELQKTLLMSPKALCLCQNPMPQNQATSSSSTNSTTNNADTEKTNKGKKKVGF